MTDWSEIFEKRLQTVLQDGERTGRKTAAFDLTPPSTTRRGLGMSLNLNLNLNPNRTKDPTSAFFESMRRQSGGQTSRYDNGGPVMAPAAQTTPSPAFAVDAEESVKRLQESYSSRARDLHEEAMQRLDMVQETLEAELKDMAQQAEHFLSAAAEQQAQCSRPADEWVVKIQTRDGAVKSAMKNAATTTQKDERVVDRIKTIREAADMLKTDLAQLWEQWSAAQKEASTVLQTITGGGGPNGPSANVGDIMSKAEKELDAAAAEAMKEMRENEKTFKKLIYAEECKIAQTMLSRQSKYD